MRPTGRLISQEVSFGLQPATTAQLFIPFERIAGIGVDHASVELWDVVRVGDTLVQLALGYPTGLVRRGPPRETNLCPRNRVRYKETQMGNPSLGKIPRHQEDDPMTRSKRNAVMIAATAMFTALALAQTAAAQELKFVFGTSQTEKTSFGKAFTGHWDEFAQKHSQGRIDIDGAEHWGSSLCSEHNCVEQMAQGAIHLTNISAGNIGAFGTTYDIVNLPYIFRDLANAKKVILGWLGDELQGRAHDEMGLHILSLWPSGGFRQLPHTQREIRVPADLKGFKIRVTKSPTEYELITAWGGVAIPYDWAQLYQGLQSGVVQGMYLQDAWTHITKMYEVTPFITHTGGAFGGNTFLMNNKYYQGLPDWGRQAIDKIGADLGLKTWEYDNQWHEDAVAGLTAAGVKFYNPTPSEMELWFRGAVNAWVKAKGTFDAKTATRVLEEQGMTSLIADLKSAGAL